MNRQQWIERVSAALKEEQSQPERWIYLSFATRDGETFRGGLIVYVHGITHGALKAEELGINPGGQIMARDVPPERLPPESFRNRLLSKEDIKEIWPDAIQVRETRKPMITVMKRVLFIIAGAICIGAASSVLLRRLPFFWQNIALVAIFVIVCSWLIHIGLKIWQHEKELKRKIRQRRQELEGSHDAH